MNDNPIRRRTLTSSEVLDAAIAIDRGNPAPNLGLAEATDPRAIDLFWKATGGPSGSIRTISQLSNYICEHDADKNFLLAIHRQMLAEGLMEILL